MELSFHYIYSGPWSHAYPRTSCEEITFDSEHAHREQTRPSVDQYHRPGVNGMKHFPTIPIRYANYVSLQRIIIKKAIIPDLATLVANHPASWNVTLRSLQILNYGFSDQVLSLCCVVYPTLYIPSIDTCLVGV